MDLSWVLLSLRTTPKPDLQYSPAQCTLRHKPLLPGGLIALPAAPDPDIPSLPKHHYSPHHSQPYLDLLHATHILVQNDASRPMLDPPYTEPFYVLERDSKNFTVELSRRSEVVSADRVKPALLPSEDPVSSTRCGRIVCRPRRFLQDGGVKWRLTAHKYIMTFSYLIIMLVVLCLMQ